ncbi:hypothetical protein GGQ80_002214 [Sphingomonas jinjuensis]|uniref:Uncharacterized protein n=1 Tax=Sphingomonas jinjuensis TaxID=535907 RepID=A0A840FC62_9SPHN|nr:hypothetical protein [Sphingomonas jinjuensis]
MDDPLRDALVIEVINLPAVDLVFEQSWAARAYLELILIVADWYAVVGRQYRVISARYLVELAAVAGATLLGFVISLSDPQTLRDCNACALNVRQEVMAHRDRRKSKNGSILAIGGSAMPHASRQGLSISHPG